MIPVVDEALLAAARSLPLVILIKATLILLLGMAGACLARASRAALRHTILNATFVALALLPPVSILAPPLRIPVAAAQPARPAANRETQTVREIPRTTADNAGLHRAPADRGTSAAFALWFMAWICGAALASSPIFIGLRNLRTLRRTALAWPHGQSVAGRLAGCAKARDRVEVLLHPATPGPMTCGVVRHTIFLPAAAQTWDTEELNRALIHELEHVRRHDWLSQFLARGVCVAFWFHPLVWLARQRLALEAERSCDDAVLARSEATAYAGQLVALARSLKSPARGIAMASRADLAARVAAVLDSRRPRGPAGAAAAALVCAAAAVLSSGISALVVVAAPQSATRQFDAVSVKLIASDVWGEHSEEHSDPGRLELSGNLHRFIIRAYGITDGQLGGEPEWFKTRLYSIEAVTSTRANVEEMMLMLRGALEERFQLKLRQEERQLPVYALEVDRHGPKFKELKPGEKPVRQDAPPSVFATSFASIQALLNSLNRVYGGKLGVDRPVVDRTHLSGRYNIQLQTEIELQPDGATGRLSYQFPNLFHDLQAQLGLKLVPARLPMPFFLVENAAAPSPN